MNTVFPDLHQKVLRAANRIRPHVRETPLVHSLHLSRMSGCNVFMKLENLQYTGSFKARGAMNKLLSLNSVERNKGVVAASTGNHGAAVAFGLKWLGLKGIVFVPENASSSKLQMIRDLGAEIRVHGMDGAVTEAYARRYAEENGMTYVSPYNDAAIIAGQGTIAEELSRQIEEIDAIFVSLGGGGLISGIAGFVKSSNPEAQIIGCSPENSPVMIESLKAAEIIEMESLPTLSDGTAGGIEPGAITFQLVREWVDEFETVSEEEIKELMRMFVEKEHLLIEGAAAVAVAGMLKRKNDYQDKNVVVVICGGNVGLEVFRSIIC